MDQEETRESENTAPRERKCLNQQSRRENNKAGSRKPTKAQNTFLSCI